MEASEQKTLDKTLEMLEQNISNLKGTNKDTMGNVENPEVATIILSAKDDVANARKAILAITPTPTVTGLTTAQKTYCRGRVTYMKGHLDKLDASAVKAPTVLAESAKVRAGLAALDTAIVKDPITMPSGRPLGLARYSRRR